MKLLNWLSSLLDLTSAMSGSNFLRASTAAATERNLQAVPTGNATIPPKNATYFSQYRGNLTTLMSDGCGTPIPTVAHLICNGTISLLNTTDPYVACEAIDESLLPEGYSSGLTCIPSPKPPSTNQTIPLAGSTMITLPGGNGTSLSRADIWGRRLVELEDETLWTNVDYQCSGLDVGHIDTIFLYGTGKNYTPPETPAPAEEGANDDEGVFRQGDASTTCEFHHYAQLAINCNDRRIPYFASSSYFECDRPSRATLLDGTHPSEELICTYDEAVCDDEGSDECQYQMAKVVADATSFARQCIQSDSTNPIPSFPRFNANERDPGQYIATFQVNYAYLFKETNTWTDMKNGNCTGDLPSFRLSCERSTITMPEDLDLGKMVCETQGSSSFSCKIPPPNVNDTVKTPFEEYINKWGETMIYVSSQVHNQEYFPCGNDPILTHSEHFHTLSLLSELQRHQ
jgi:hypothetical protein